MSLETSCRRQRHRRAWETTAFGLSLRGCDPCAGHARPHKHWSLLSPLEGPRSWGLRLLLQGHRKLPPHHLPQGEQYTESSPFLENDRPHWSSDIQTLPLEKANIRVKRANAKAGSWPLHPHSAPRPSHKRGLLLRGSQCAHKRKEL